MTFEPLVNDRACASATNKVKPSSFKLQVGDLGRDYGHKHSTHVNARESSISDEMDQRWIRILAKLSITVH